MKNTGYHPAAAGPNIAPDYPVVEILAPSLDDEARTAMAIVDGLLDAGVHRRDVAIVAREIDAYEQSLTRAAIRYGTPPVCWNQIDLTHTRLYNLLVTICELLGADAVHPHDLSRALALGWIPPDPDADEWPLSTQAAVTACNDGPDGPLSLPEWEVIITQPWWPEPRVATLVTWLLDYANTAPSQTAIKDVLGGVVARYREEVLPVVKMADGPALLQTETAARATVRLQTLVNHVAVKYRQQSPTTQSTTSWTEVAGLIESIANQSPGRREHANAYAIDILEANDIWQRDIPYIIAIGLVEGRWPLEPDSVFPPRLRQALLAGTGSTSIVVPRTQWVAGRDYDQFVETVESASAGLVVTRHTQTHDGIEPPRSSLLNLLDTETIDRTARQRLVSADRQLPAPIRSMLDEHTTSDGDSQ